MSQNPGNKKANNRRKRPTSHNSASGKAKQKATPNPQPSTTTAPKTTPAASAQTTRRNVRKEAAQAQAKKKQQLQLIIGGVAAAVVIAVVLILVNRPSNDGVKINFDNVAIAQSDVVTNMGTPSASPEAAGPLQFSTGSTVGDPNAPVTMHIFMDFQCHFCLSFHNETLPKIVEDFVKTGQVRLVFHDYPFLGTDQSLANPDDLTVEIADPNNESSLAAQAAMCSGEQGKYLEMSDKLYANYGGIQTGAFKRSNLDRFAGDLGLDVDAFKSCMDSGRYIPALAESKKQAAEQGVSSTPMFILDNGGDLNVIQQTEEGYSLMKKQIEASIKSAP